MNKYKIYEHPSRRVKLIEPVKQGDSVPAFLFTWFWALWKQLWLVAFAGWLFNVAGWIIYIEIFTYANNSPVTTKLFLLSFNTIFVLSINAIFGVKGNSWREYYLRSNGYQRVKEINARTPEEARQIFTGATNVNGAKIGEVVDPDMRAIPPMFVDPETIEETIGNIVCSNK